MKKIPSMPSKAGAQLDYDKLFDGNAWELEQGDFSGRKINMVASAIRNAAYRERISVEIVKTPKGTLAVKADRNRTPVPMGNRRAS